MTSKPAPKRTIADDFADLDAKLNGWPLTGLIMLLAYLAWHSPAYAAKVTVAGIVGILFWEAVGRFVYRPIRDRRRERLAGRVRVVVVATTLYEAARVLRTEYGRRARKYANYVVLTPRHHHVPRGFQADRIVFASSMRTHPRYGEMLVAASSCLAWKSSHA